MDLHAPATAHGRQPPGAHSRPHMQLNGIPCPLRLTGAHGCPARLAAPPRRTRGRMRGAREGRRGGAQGASGPHRELRRVLVADVVGHGLEIGGRRGHEGLPGAAAVCPAASGGPLTWGGEVGGLGGGTAGLRWSHGQDGGRLASLVSLLTGCIPPQPVLMQVLALEHAPSMSSAVSTHPEDPGCVWVLTCHTRLHQTAAAG
jgi:hypothetical protein